MSFNWDPVKVQALAPDETAFKAAQKVASAKAWTTFAGIEQGVWGMFQGSAREPYCVAVDIRGPAFYCTCPSVKIPCKHVLGLLLHCAELGDLPQAELPVWAAEWFAKQDAKQAALLKSAAAEPTRRKEAARRSQRREGRVAAGLLQCQVWLQDLLRSGLSAPGLQNYAFWETQAASLVDAQAPGAARRVREMGRLPYGSEGWQAALLERLGRLDLLIEAYQRLDELPPALQAEVRVQIGWPQRQEEIISQPGIHDRWVVAGRRLMEEPQGTPGRSPLLLVERTWFLGERSRRIALQLQFAPAGQALERRFMVNTCFEGEIVFFPGAFPLRGIVKNAQNHTEYVAPLQGYQTLVQAFDAYASALAANPWLEVLAWPLKDVRPVPDGERWWLVDGQGQAVLLAPNFPFSWQLFALSGGSALDLCGEWDGQHFWPLGVFQAGRRVVFGRETPGPQTAYSAAYMAHWGWLLGATLAGSAQMAQMPAEDAGELGSLLRQVPARGREAALLHSAALYAVWGRAGQRPAAAPVVLPQPSLSETMTLPAPAASLRLHQLLESDLSEELLYQWLAALQAAGKRVHPEFLPALLDLGQTKTRPVSSILAVMGQRGAWLAAHNPLWEYAALPLGEAFADWAQAWETGSPACRRNVLRQLRQRDAQAGLKLLSSTWDTEGAERRAVYLACLEAGLSLSDEPFLAQVLQTDRAKEVRRVALDLLGRLAGTQFSQRIWKRAQQVLRLQGQGRLVSRPRLEVVFPANLDPELELFGSRLAADKEGALRGKGGKAYWLIGLLSFVPPAEWVKAWRVPVGEILKLAQKSEWKDALVEGWTGATHRFLDQTWATELLKIEPDRINLLKVLPQTGAEQWVAKYWQAHADSAGMSRILALSHPWSREFSLAVLSKLRPYYTSLERSRAAWQLRQALQEVGMWMDYELADEVLPALLPAAERDANWQLAVRGLASLLEYRRAMRREILADG